jgi:MFS transporter, putative metabolite:H+ symporter
MSTPIAQPFRSDEREGPTLAETGARLDRLPFSRWHAYFLLAIAFILVFQYMDNYAFSYASPGAIKELHITTAQVGNLGTIYALGGLLGALIAGIVLVDRIGRRRTLLIFTAIYASFCILNAFVGNVDQFYVARGLSGFGAFGASIPALAAMAEVCPFISRGRMITIMTMVGGCGPAAMSWIAHAIVPAAPGDWRWLFGISALGFIALFASLILVPESPRWLVTRGRGREAERILERIERSVERQRGTLPPVEIPEGAAVVAAQVVPGLKGLWVNTIYVFRQGYLRRWLLVGFLLLGTGFAYTGIGFFLPTLLYLNGGTAAGSLDYAAIIFTCGNAAAFLFWFVADRFERKDLIAVGGVILGASTLIYGTTHNAVLIYLFGIIMIAFLQVQVAYLYTFETELFPTHVRGNALATVGIAASVLGVYGSRIITDVFTTWGYASVYILLAAMEFLFAIVVVFLGERTTRRSVESLNEFLETARSMDSAPARAGGPVLPPGVEAPGAVPE